MTEINIQLERVRPAPSSPDKNTETRYRVTLGARVLGIWRDPECSAARKLLELGLAKREDTLRTWRGDQPCMHGGIGWLADRRVSESDRKGQTGTPRFVRWVPPPVLDLSGGRLKSGRNDD